MADYNPLPTFENVEPGDDYLTKDELQQLSVFKEMADDPVNWDRYPGTTILRRCAPGRVLCRQGEPGHTAFYILRRPEVTALRRYQLEVIDSILGPPPLAPHQPEELPAQPAADKDDSAAPPPESSKEKEAPRLRDYLSGKSRAELETLRSAAAGDLENWRKIDPGTDADERVAVVQLFTLSDKERSGVLGRFLAKFFRPSGREARDRPSSIRNDGFRDLDGKTRQAEIREGELFGEMSCMNRAPRSATVTVERPCYVLEMRRNILDAFRKDPVRKFVMDREYRKRVLDLHVRNLAIFRNCPDPQLDAIREQIELIDIEPGAVLFEQRDEPDACYIIRSGMIKVVQHAYAKLHATDFSDSDWAKLWGRWAAPADSQHALAPVFWGEFERIRVRLTKAASDIASERTKLQKPLTDKAKKAGKIGPKPDDVKALLQKLLEDETKIRESLQRVSLIEEAAKAAREARTQKMAALTNPAAQGPPTLKSGPRMAAMPGAASPAGSSAAHKSALVPPDPPCPSEIRQSLLAAMNLFIEEGRAHIPTIAPSTKEPAFKGKATRDEILAEVNIPELSARRDELPEKPAHWPALETRVFHRLLLETIFGPAVPSRGKCLPPPRTLAYRGRGDTIGEMGLLRNEPRTATCIAFAHPDYDIKDASGSKMGAVLPRVELIRIKRSLFESLASSDPAFKKLMQDLATSRTENGESAVAMRIAGARRSRVAAVDRTEFEGKGLHQGQNLLVIDLDRCTRCGSCVDACVAAHDDHHTRLYLDGPRFDQYLVPLSCRKCHDPVCMIGCPVGSIVQGPNLQIEIKDWCIGCAMCANQCPYGSIQIEELPEPVTDARFPQTRKLVRTEDKLKFVARQAVVCDLCSSRPKQGPACVYACPHDAALRVNASDFFFSAGSSSSSGSQPSTSN